MSSTDSCWCYKTKVCAAQQDDIEEMINLFAYKKCEHVVLPSRRKNSLIKWVFSTQDGLQTYKYFSDDINPMRRGVHNRWLVIDHSFDGNLRRSKRECKCSLSECKCSREGSCWCWPVSTTTIAMWYLTASESSAVQIGVWTEYCTNVHLTQRFCSKTNK